MFLEALQKVLADHVDSAAIRAIEGGDSGAAIWQPIEEAGFLALMQPESHGGAALTLPELFPILECLGHHVLPLPVAQTIVARALVGPQAELPVGMVTLATQWQILADGGAVAMHVPAGHLAAHVLVADGERLLLLAAMPARREPVGDPRSQVAHLRWADPAPVLELPTGGGHLPAFAAAMTAAQISGGLQRCFDMALDHCNTRVQFGKSIGKFQALQQQLSTMAEHVLAASIAAEAAFRCEGAAPDRLAAAVAKSRASEAVGLVAATAHAVHGAIGMTDEYDLALVTRRLHAWRMQHGAEGYWNRQIGREVMASEKTLFECVRAV